MAQQKERRHARRFRMRLPITLTWASKAGSADEMRAETSEVSSKGVRFSTEKGMRSGTPVEFEMTLPHEVTLAGPVRVRCLGRVVRADAMAEQRVGVSVAIERYEFVRGDQTAA